MSRRPQGSFRAATSRAFLVEATASAKALVYLLKEVGEEELAGSPKERVGGGGSC